MQDLLPQLSYYFDISIHEVFYNIASSVQRLEECFLERLPSILMNDNKPIKIMNFIHPDYLPYCGEDESGVVLPGNVPSTKVTVDTMTRPREQ